MIGPDFISGISGQSEDKIRKLFQEAKQNSPSIIYIDEIESIAGSKNDSYKEMGVRIVSQLITCMDDLSSTDTLVWVIGSTSRPEKLEQSLRREGRFEKEITIGVPNKDQIT